MIDELHPCGKVAEGLSRGPEYRLLCLDLTGDILKGGECHTGQITPDKRRALASVFRSGLWDVCVWGGGAA